MDTIPTEIVFVEGLAVDTQIGVAAWEQKTRQRVVVDMKVALSVPFADIEDRLEQTVDYTKLTALIEKILTTSSFSLLETAAHKIAIAIETSYPQINWLSLTLRKPQALLTAQATGVTVIRQKPSL